VTKTTAKARPANRSAFGPAPVQCDGQMSLDIHVQTVTHTPRFRVKRETVDTIELPLDPPPLRVPRPRRPPAPDWPPFEATYERLDPTGRVVPGSTETVRSKSPPTPGGK